ncbi:hypothetical protein GLOIN_2v1780400 [Rhizophagus irregularis DAOM 181602=DAOM 197198]|uniref:Uncharacterized protein n=1 Tax=Rhizophagus irregularis (strain DAOM 181602 / DAOM 197198 / MUCL 43194) TaxID=747089 RepID=A0A2P4PMF7_RHIID|nr:hypothetical protein GLOIN_2v1780400 [Rhizophagus irregularis DAOM 181602=DAOM 197198]POG66560.1 hypothetical protein GLOIN_2v1780400 [Rhizophagus irregularis DAOM 181602=DAOM 197198]|eukprot:XP_025173426.1 hypothetical protein GLOIN_2v1780400 [Rhizophagus irregularis DAOM 181602=DAOM 197198]
MAHWKDWYDIEVKSWIFLEAREAKTAIDSHHAQIAHAIKRYVRIGFEIREGSDIKNSIKDLCDNSYKHLRINTTNKNLVQINNGIVDTENNFNVNTEFQLTSGWVLKANQKFRKRGGARISKKVIALLQGFFYAGNADKSDRYSANDMLSELIHMVNNGELDPEIIPKIETIENWISRYSATCKHKMAAIALERQMQNQP